MALLAMRGLMGTLPKPVLNSYLSRASRQLPLTGHQRRAATRQARSFISGNNTAAARQTSALLEKQFPGLTRHLSQAAGASSTAAAAARDRSMLQRLRQYVLKFTKNADPKATEGSSTKPAPFRNFDKGVASKSKGKSGGEGSSGNSSAAAGGNEAKKAGEEAATKGEEAAKKGADKGAAAEGSGKASRGAEGESGAGGGKKDSSSSSSSSGGGGKGSKKGGRHTSEEPEFDSEQQEKMALGALAVVTLAAVFMIGPSLENKETMGKNVSWQEFQGEYLRRGLVERIVVYNKSTAVAELRADTGDFISEPVDSRQSGGGGGGRRVAGHVNFAIASIDNFERKLEYAQRELGLPSYEFVPVQYEENVDWAGFALRMAPTLLLIGAWVFFMGRGMGGMGGGMGGMGGKAGGIFNIGKANPATKASTSSVTFADVAGCNEAKAEIMEFVSFLKNPERFARLGAKIPKGALLVGPPGTGKTLLAKATAGESSVPFFSMSGSDFIEMFVGVGPSRVRDLFKKARESAPCIIFIDEIDAVARARSKGGFSGGNDERENTLNQLLVEMDGFSTKEGVVVLAGTNRADILDKAILRPGRFDRQIHVELPDIDGRRDIFKVYLKKLTVEGDIDQLADRLAALTVGFAGADIANIANEGAIVAARRDAESITLADFEKAVDRVIGGMERAGGMVTEEEKRTVAYHEAGHAIAGWFLQNADPLLKVTIIPRSSGALGFAQYLPKEMALQTTEQLKDMMCMALGGRAAEEIIFGRITTGASDDLRKVTAIASQMIKIYGMNSRVGQLSYPPNQSGDPDFTKPFSEATAQVIDEELKLMVDEMYARTKALLLEHEDDLRAVAELLLEKETINVDDVINLVGPRPFKMPSSYADFLKRAWQADPDEKDEEIEDGSVAVDIGLATMERYESDWERQIEAARRSRR